MRSRISLSLAEIVAKLGGTLEGPPDFRVHSVATLISAGPSDITFLSSSRYRHLLDVTRAGAVIVRPEDAGRATIPRVVTNSPYAYLAKLLPLFTPEEVPVRGIHPGAFVHPEACVSHDAGIGFGCAVEAGVTIGANVRIGSGCTVGAGSTVGDDTVLHSNVTVYHDCVIGKRCILHAGSVIGADGFGMALENGRWLKVPQVGRVVLGDDVEVGANTTIDRGALDDTVIEDGVKLDNQIQIGHNVRVGAHTAMAGCVGIAGSARIGRHCTFGGGAIVLGHLEIADQVNIGAGSLVAKSILQPGTYCGVYPLQTKSNWTRGAVQLRRIDELADRLRMLERQLARHFPLE